MAESVRAGRGGRRTVAALVGIIVVMGALAYASVPLYRLFCQVTGFGGTTQRAERAAGPVLDREIEIRFNADISDDLAWSFRPVERTLKARVGEEMLAFYRAENIGSEVLVGSATFNVTPLKAGQYFSKIECFCFTEQRLGPGESADMPVSFFVDPAIAEDPSLDDVSTITLSYTFFKVREREAALSREQTHGG